MLCRLDYDAEECAVNPYLFYLHSKHFIQGFALEGLEIFCNFAMSGLERSLEV